MRAAGWLAGAAVLAFGAGALPSLALFALSVGMLLVVAGAAVTVLVARSRVAVARTVMEHEISEAEPLRLRFDVRLPRWLPARLEIEVGRREWAILEEPYTVELPIGRRGAHRVEPSRLRLGDALGIFRRTVRTGEPQTVLVLPEPDPDALAVPVPRAFDDASEPDGLRPYVPGTPVTRIHWLSLARGHGLHERRLAPPPTGPPLVVVDPAGADDPRAVDWLARVAAGRVLGLAREGGCEVLLPGEGKALAVRDEPSWHEVHRRLALLDGFRRVAVPPGGAALVLRVPDGLPLPPPYPEPPPGIVHLDHADLEHL